MPSARKRLQVFAAALLALNAAAAGVAVAANWPAQFGGVGTDAGEEFLSRGTAISAPLLPAILLIAVISFARRTSMVQWIAIVAAYLTAVLVFIGGMGELAAEPTADTPKTVLVGSGIVSGVAALALAYLATKVVQERRHRAASAS